MEPKTKQEMKTIAQEMFGPDAWVRYDEDQWIIETGVGERFNPEEYHGRSAYASYIADEDTYGTELERWAHKNGHGRLSTAELFDAWDLAEELTSRTIVKEVREYIDNGGTFDWEGGPEYRDMVLKYAKENGL